ANAAAIARPAPFSNVFFILPPSTSRPSRVPAQVTATIATRGAFLWSHVRAAPSAPTALSNPISVGRRRVGDDGANHTALIGAMITQRDDHRALRTDGRSDLVAAPRSGLASAA